MLDIASDTIRLIAVFGGHMEIVEVEESAELRRGVSDSALLSTHGTPTVAPTTARSESDTSRTDSKSLANFSASAPCMFVDLLPACANFFLNPLPTTLMIRQAFRMRVPVEHAAEYKRRHDEIWPLLVDELKAAGISDYSIFLDEQTGDLFGMMKIEDPRKLEELATKDIMKQWWEMNKDIQIYEGDRPYVRPLKEVFHLP